jgi:hypothetical protein
MRLPWPEKVGSLGMWLQLENVILHQIWYTKETNCCNGFFVAFMDFV